MSLSATEARPVPGSGAGRRKRPGRQGGSLLRRIYERTATLWRPDQIRAWADPYRRRGGAVAFAVRQVEAMLLALRHALQDDLTRSAAALTYNTMLALVPLLAVAFALFDAFGGLQRLKAPLQDLLLANLAAGRADEVGAWLEAFISRINAGAIAGVGVLFLIWAAVGLLGNVEGTLNRIWGVQRGRGLMTRIFMYWGILTLTPPLLALSISVTARLQSLEFASAVLGWLPFGLGRLVLWFGTVVATALAFMLTYLIVPNTKVRLRSAALGGLVASLIWNLLKALFIGTISGSLNYNVVYGALGVLPILMLWLYLSWIVVLFGATYTAANQSLHTEGLELSNVELNQHFREQLGVRVAVAVAAAFHRGEPPPTLEELSAGMGAMGPVLRRVLDVLTFHGVLAETQLAGGEVGYLPGRDLEELQLSRVVEVLRHRDGSSFVLEGEVGNEAAALLDQAEQNGAQVLSVSLRTLAQRARPLGEPG